MKCGDVMKVAVVRCHESDSVGGVARQMRDEGIGFVPIVDAFERVIGVVTDRDLATRVLAADLGPNLPVGQVMTREPLLVCDPEEDLREVEARMAVARRSRILVCDRVGRCKGLISLADIAQVDDADSSGRVLRNVTRREAVRITGEGQQPR